jgi:hypothetical protein
MSIQSPLQPWQTITERGQEEKTVGKEGRRRREGEGTAREEGRERGGVRPVRGGGGNKDLREEKTVREDGGEKEKEGEMKDPLPPLRCWQNSSAGIGLPPEREKNSVGETPLTW